MRFLFQAGLLLLVSLNGCTVEQTKEAVDAGSVKSVVLSYPSIDSEMGENCILLNRRSHKSWRWLLKNLFARNIAQGVLAAMRIRKPMVA